MDSDDLHKHVFKTYLTLRYGVVVLGIVFPPLLWFLGLSADDIHRSSMSAAYHAGGLMRDVFVGILFAVGACLCLYKGFSHWENRALNVTGISAGIVALFPTQEAMSMHTVGVVGVFLTIAYVYWFRASDTLYLIEDDTRKKRYRVWYKLLGVLLAVVPVTVWLLAPRLEQLTFVMEGAAIWMFALYWWVKSSELNATHADGHALKGELAIGPS